MKASEQRRRWAANALAMAAELPDSTDRDKLLLLARQHLLAIVQEASRAPVTEHYVVMPSGIW